MKKIVSLFLMVMFFASCKIPIVNKIADKMQILDDPLNSEAFTFLDDKLIGKDIILLGEASHGDGKTFEVKSHLVKYLIEQKKFNVIAFEQRDFFEMEFINGRPSLDKVIDEKVRGTDWLRQWSPWGPAQEIQPLIDVLSVTDLEYIGLEPYSHRSIPKVIVHLLKTAKALGMDNLSTEEWEQLNYIHIYMNANGEDPVSEEQYLYYCNTLERFFATIPDSTDLEIAFLSQMIENAITSAKMKQMESGGLTDEERNKHVDIRDAQMAKNLIWFRRRNPDAKIIVWLANMHGAKKLGDVQFDGEDPLRYKKFTVLGEHLHNAYGSSVYSLAFTSSRGNSKVPYNFEGVEETLINAPVGSLEKQLDRKNADFGFVDFNIVKKNHSSLIDKEFYSIMLGYYNQIGKWLNVFDGLIYIRENHKATPIKSK